MDNKELFNQVSSEILDGIDTRSRRTKYRLENSETKIEWDKIGEMVTMTMTGIFLIFVVVFLTLQ